MTSFSVTIEPKESNTASLEFTLNGNDEYGLDKSIVNSLRRILLSEIPCVAFRNDEEQKKEMLQNAEATLSELRKRDPGGDIVL